MSARPKICPDCEAQNHNPPSGRAAVSPFGVHRREFLKTAGAVTLAGAALPRILHAAEPAAGTPESLVKVLYDSLSETQKSTVCFDWDHVDGERGLLRTRVANNWKITDPNIDSDFYTKDQQATIRDIFEGIYNPDWIERIDKQLQDDAGGYGYDQSLAIFGTPGSGTFEFVMTGRHLTIRCDGDSTEHVAFGGPIFYGHAASGFNEDAAHTGNVFWHQAVEANKLFNILDGRQQKLALVAMRPAEQQVGFRGTGGGYPGIPLTEMSTDQREHVQKILKLLIEPYRQADQDEAVACLNAQGGLDACSLAFYQEGDIDNDKVWDCWRLEGPAFVWYFRGEPHVHVWVNVASDPSVVLNA
jgi:hypothetical protein